MKEILISIRINEELKNELEMMSVSNSQSVSELVRESIYKHLAKPEKDTCNVKLSNKELEIIQSLGFTEFIFWISDKKRDSGCFEVDELYVQFINLINEMNNHPLFNKEIIVEFNKVKDEFEDYLSFDNLTDDSFQLPKSEIFDYEKLYDFMHTIRYDEDNNLVVHIK